MTYGTCITSVHNYSITLNVNVNCHLSIKIKITKTKKPYSLLMQHYITSVNLYQCAPIKK